jgi:thiamine kinase
MPARDAEPEPVQFAAMAAELGLHEPQVIGLCGGLANHSWRLRDGRQDLVLRQAGRSGLLGADRHAELAMLRMAAAAGLAPPIVLARPAEGLLVTRYVDGPVLSLEELRQHAMLVRIGKWFGALHALSPPQGLTAVDFGARAAQYLEQLSARRSAAFLRRLKQALKARRASLPAPRRLVACHHDLHHLNIVERGDELIALDWEYAGVGDPAADLAACIGYHNLDCGQTEAILAGYGGDSQSLRRRLLTLGWIFDCLWFGWLENAARQGIEADASRRQLLIDRLLS